MGFKGNVDRAMQNLKDENKILYYNDYRTIIGTIVFAGNPSFSFPSFQTLYKKCNKKFGLGGSWRGDEGDVLKNKAIPFLVGLRTEIIAILFEFAAYRKKCKIMGIRATTKYDFLVFQRKIDFIFYKHFEIGT